MKLNRKSSKAQPVRAGAAVNAPMRRAWAASLALALSTGIAGGPAYALGLFGLKTPERVSTGAGVAKLAETDPSAASYNAVLNGWSDWVFVIVLVLVIAAVVAVAKKHAGDGEGHRRGGLAGILVAILGVLMVGGIAA